MAERKLPAGLPECDTEKLRGSEYWSGVPNINQEPGSKLSHCLICGWYPSFPIELPCCHRNVCDICLLQHRRINFSYASVIKCPVCVTDMHIKKLIPYHRWQPGYKMIYRENVVNCPECNWCGDPIEMREHRLTRCPRRSIHCPNYDCEVKMEASRMESEHYSTCNKYQIYCPTCRLSVLASDLPTHNFLERMKEALEGMLTQSVVFFYETYNIH